jgi:hypothetical protein
VNVTIQTTTTGDLGDAVTKTVKAEDYYSGTATTTYKSSAVTSGTYKVENIVGAPKFSPNGSSSTSAISVSIADTWTGTNSLGKVVTPTIYYATSSTDTAPALSGFVAYVPKSTNLQLPLSGETTTYLFSYASALGYLPSGITSAAFGAATNSGISYFIGAGSSAQFFEYALAFAGVPGNDGPCGGHHFTKSNGAQAADVRSGVTPADTGNLLIVWDNSADGTGSAYPSPAGPTKICVYLSLDSTLGVKAFFNSNLKVPAEFLNITATSGTSNSIAPFWPSYSSSSVVAGADENSIPADVLAAAQGQPFNVAITDIRPEDAKFATTRALGALNATRTGLGYGPGPIGKPIVSVAGTTFNVVNFALSGADPITGSLQQPYTTVPIGAAPVVVFVNTTAGTSGDGLYHFGDTTNPVKNISRFTLAGYLNGTITGTGAVAPIQLGAGSNTQNSAPVHVWLREPLSGTYNTVEFNIPASKEIGSSQEIGVNPKVTAVYTSDGKNPPDGGTSTTLPTWISGGDANKNSGNPLFIQVYPSAAGITTNPLGNVNATGVMIGVAGATRARAIGTGEEVKQVALAGADNIGYSFWGYGNLKSGNNSATTTTKYITVDGVDPINAEYTAGVYPTCTAASYEADFGCPNVPFTNVINGSYPIWSVYRAVTASPTPSFVSTILAAAETSSTTAFDFAPLTSLQVFRSHYLQDGVAPSNGHSSVSTAPYTAYTEAGGDVGGAVFTIQADYDHIADYGVSTANPTGEILNVRQ